MSSFIANAIWVHSHRLLNLYIWNSMISNAITDNVCEYEYFSFSLGPQRILKQSHFTNWKYIKLWVKRTSSSGSVPQDYSHVVPGRNWICLSRWRIMFFILDSGWPAQNNSWFSELYTLSLCHDCRMNPWIWMNYNSHYFFYAGTFLNSVGLGPGGNLQWVNYIHQFENTLCNLDKNIFVAVSELSSTLLLVQVEINGESATFSNLKIHFTIWKNTFSNFFCAWTFLNSVVGPGGGGNLRWVRFCSALMLPLLPSYSPNQNCPYGVNCHP